MSASAQKHPRRRSDGAAAAILALGVLAAVVAEIPVQAGGRGQTAIPSAEAELTTGGLPDDGMPPTPGPTNPDGAS